MKNHLLGGISAAVIALASVASAHATPPADGDHHAEQDQAKHEDHKAGEDHGDHQGDHHDASHDEHHEEGAAHD